MLWWPVGRAGASLGREIGAPIPIGGVDIPARGAGVGALIAGGGGLVSPSLGLGIPGRVSGTAEGQMEPRPGSLGPQQGGVWG